MSSDKLDEFEKSLLTEREWISESMTHGVMMDEDGYPTETALEIIRRWPPDEHPSALFDFIETIWQYNIFSRSEEPHEWSEDVTVTRIHMSTAGWSGNESIIEALQQNKWLLWSFFWVQSRRGGHYIFEYRNIG